MILRINRGKFDPANRAQVTKLLAESEQILAPAIKQLKGFHSYQTGVDGEKGIIIAASLWESAEEGAKVGTLPEMVSQRQPMEAAGVVFEPVTNIEILWEVIKI